MWYELKIKAYNEILEAINNILYLNGACGIVIEDPNDFMYTNENSKNWDYFEIDMSNFEYDKTLIKAYIEFGEGKNHKNIDYSTMSGKIVSLNGKQMASKLEKDYKNFKVLFSKIKTEIFDLKKYGFETDNIEFEYTELENIDYNKKWQENYKEFSITDDIVICPSWIKKDFDNKKVIILDPGMAFGTGIHETTSMCAKMIEKYKKLNNAQILYDIGTGSGILSLIAKKLGFLEVIGVDIDEDAVKTSIENAKINDLDIKFYCGNLLEVFDKKADIVVANIIADVINSMKDDLKQILSKNSVFIASGIIKEKLDEVVNFYKEDYDILETKIKGEWAIIVCKLK